MSGRCVESKRERGRDRERERERERARVSGTIYVNTTLYEDVLLIQEMHAAPAQAVGILASFRYRGAHGE